MLCGLRDKSFPRTPAQALRQGDWKIYRDSQDKPAELYNLLRNPDEMHDFAGDHPATVSKLEAMMSQAHIDSAEFPQAGRKAKNRE